MAVDGQYAHNVLVCDRRIRGTAVCHIKGRCSICEHAYKFEHPDEA